MTAAAGEAPQAIAISGALIAAWPTGKVTQCEVQQSFGSNPTPVYEVFIKSVINGVPYDLTIGLIHYVGPGQYVGTFPNGSSLSTLYKDPPLRANALAEYDAEHRAVVVVRSDQAGGTIDAYFAPPTDPLPPPHQSVDPDPAKRVHVQGSWNCGSFPIHHTVAASPSP